MHIAEPDPAAADPLMDADGGAPPDTVAVPEPLQSNDGRHWRLPPHLNARGLALGIIATVPFVFALQWSQKFLVPLLLGIFIASVSVKLVVAFNDDYAARRWLSLLADFAGFRCTTCTGVQLRVVPLHRCGWRALAAS